MDLVSRTSALAVSFCPGCVMRFTAQLQGASDSELDALRVGCHAFWNACISVALKARFDDDIGQLDQTLRASLAKCPHEPANLVQRAEASQDVVRGILDAACRCLHVALSKGSNSVYQRAQLRRKTFPNVNVYWPSTTDELFPKGPLATLSALIRWGDTISSASPIYVLNDIVGVALPFVLEPLTESMELRASLVKLMTDRLRGPVSDTTRQDGLPLRGVTRSPAWRARMAGVCAVAALLDVLQTGPDAGPRDLLTVVRAHESDVFAAILDAVAFIDYGAASTDSEGAFKTLAPVANILRERLRLPISVLPPHAFAVCHPVQGMDVYDVVAYFFCSLRAQERRRCAAPDCGKFVQHLEVAGTTCPGCKTLSYCGPLCRQRGLAAGHRKVCAGIRRLMDSCDYKKMLLDCEPWEMYHIVLYVATSTLPKELRERLDELFLPFNEIGSTNLAAMSRAERNSTFRKMFTFE